MAVVTMSAMAAVTMRGWLAEDLLPPYDFGGYVSVVEYVRDAILRFGYVPAWCSKWFGGSTQFTSTFKELLTFPLAVWIGPFRAVQLTIFVLKALAGLAMYAAILGLHRSPTAGIVAGYAYAFSMPASYGTSVHLHLALSLVLFPLLILSATNMLRQRSATWAVALGILAACQFSNNYVVVVICGVTVLLLLLLRPWRQAASDDDVMADGQLRRQWSTLLALALVIFVLFAASQLAWLVADLGHHSLHDPEEVSWGVDVFIEHSPFAYFNRGNWLGGWLADHHPPDMPLFPDEPLRNQRHYLGIVAMSVGAFGWLLARRDYSLRRWYQFFGLLFLLQHWLSMGTRTLMWEIARTFGWPERLDRPLHLVLGIAALGCLLFAFVRWRRARAAAREGFPANAAIELFLGLALLFFAASFSLFEALRTGVPLVGGMRAPGRFFELAPFALYALMGVGMIAIERVLSTTRVRALVAASLVALLAADFWPATAAYHRGSSVQPVRDFRELVRALPAEGGTLRIGQPAWPPEGWQLPTGWQVASSLVVTPSDVGAAWSWLPWQAGTHWIPYLGTSTVWLIEELAPGERERFRHVGDTLARVGRLKYFLGHPHQDLGPPWRLRATNELFSFWERPDVMPMATVHRAYVLFVGADEFQGALAASRAADLNLVSIAGGKRLAGTAAGLIEGAAVILSDRAAASADDESRRRAERYADRLIVTDSAPFSERFPEFLAAREPGTMTDARYQRPSPEHIVLNVDAGLQGAAVFVSEAYHPWWQAWVDRRPSDVMRAHVAFMAVRVGPGQHVIDMRLTRPLLVRVADRVTAFSWIGLGLAVPFYGVRRVRPA